MKKGFTLIELLAVIVILAIILLIAVPQVLEVVEDAEDNSFISTNKLVLKAADIYLSLNSDQLPQELGDTLELPLVSLEGDGFVETVKLSSTDCTGYILVTKEGEASYDYNPFINCTGNNITTSVEDGLVADFKLKTNAYDYSLNNNHGVVTGAVSTGSSYYFDGYDDVIHIDIPKETGDFTIITNVLRTGSIPADVSFASIAGWRYASEQLRGITYYGSYDFTYKDYSGSPALIFSGVNVALNTWFNVAITYTNGIASIYVDGELKNSAPQTMATQSTSGFQIGALHYTTGQNRTHTGEIGETRIYSRALSAEEVKEVYLTIKKD